LRSDAISAVWCQIRKPELKRTRVVRRSVSGLRTEENEKSVLYDGNHGG